MFDGKRRTVLKSALGGAFASVAGYTLSGNVAAQSGENNCVQVDLVEVTGEYDGVKNLVDNDNKYNDENRLISWHWANWADEQTGEDMDELPYESQETGRPVEVTENIDFDFGASEASATVEIDWDEGEEIELALTSYEAPCGSGPEPGWEGAEQHLIDSETVELSGEDSVELSVGIVPSPQPTDFEPVDLEREIGAILTFSDEVETDEVDLVNGSIGDSFTVRDGPGITFASNDYDPVLDLDDNQIVIAAEGEEEFTGPLTAGKDIVYNPDAANGFTIEDGDGDEIDGFEFEIDTVEGVYALGVEDGIIGVFFSSNLQCLDADGNEVPAENTDLHEAFEIDGEQFDSLDEGEDEVEEVVIIDDRDAEEHILLLVIEEFDPTEEDPGEPPIVEDAISFTNENADADLVSPEAEDISAEDFEDMGVLVFAPE